MEFNELIQRALTIRELYREYEELNYGVSWTEKNWHWGSWEMLVI